MRLTASLAGVAVLAFSAGAAAQEASSWTVEVSGGASYLIAGAASRAGAPATPTGGLAIVPALRVSYALASFVSVTYTQSPILVTPYSASQLGLVDANDLGLAFHDSARTVIVGAGGTGGLAWMTFCNALWCLREVVPVVGGAAFASVRIHGGARVEAFVRALYAEPTAWTWRGLPPIDRQIQRVSWLLGATGTIEF